MKDKQCTGIILSTTPYFEKDKCIEVFTQPFGKQKFLCKGAQSTKSKWGGKIEPTYLAELHYYKGKSFLLLKEATIKQSFSGIRTDFNKISMAFYFVSIIKKSTSYNQPNPQLFTLLHYYLEALTKSEHLHQTKQNFETQFLQLEGVHNPKLSFEHAFFDYTGQYAPSLTLI